MSFIRKRYYAWLLKAYFKKWSKTILVSVGLGAVSFFLIILFLNLYAFPSIQKKVQKIGYWGVRTPNTLPLEVLGDVSYGLTKLDQDGKISPGAAFRWEIKKNGKEYIFNIKKGQYFHDGAPLTSGSVNLNFKDVQKKIIDEWTVSFILKEPYSPFLSTVSKPILSEKFQGLGEYKIKKINLNAGFVKSITLENKRNASFKKIISFYPSEQSLKTSYALGEIDQAIGITNLFMKNSDINKWTNTDILKKINYGVLITLFYNNSDSVLSNKKIRQALSYALPQSFKEGERTYSPISPKSIYFSKPPNYGISDLGIARDILNSEEDVKTKIFEISTSQEYKTVAEKIVQEWSKVGVKSKVKIATGIPDKFQILLYQISLPQDPDQYTLWHTGQVNNIISYKNLRIDKLLEDGRSTIDKDRRASIYSDFQKYLLDDVPASFLYFPYEWTFSRR